MFDVTNSQQAARFGINPFQRIEIPLGPNIDRSNGEYFPSFEGSGMYIERADYPAMLSLVVKGDSVGQSMQLRDGMQVEAWFKGFILVHPAMNAPMTLSIIVFKHPDSVFVQQAPTPASRLGMCTLQVTNGATVQTYDIFVPPGMRALNNLTVVVPATTVTAASAAFNAADASLVSIPTNIAQQVGGTLHTYNFVVNPIWGPSSAVQLGANWIVKWDKIVIPSRAVELAFTINGTVMTPPINITGWFE